MTNSSSVERDDSNSEILELETIVSSARQPLVGNSNLVENVAPLPSAPAPQQKMKIPIVTQSIKVVSTGEIFDITAELDLLLRSLQLATPHPPNSIDLVDLDCDRLFPIEASPSEQGSRIATVREHRQERARRRQESNAISETIAAIAATETDSDTQLYRELSDIHQQIVMARAELQTLHQRNQSQVDAIDAKATQVNRLKVRTQQLAHYTKDRVSKVQELISTVDGIRVEIVTGLEKFGGYREIRSLLTELETTRHALVIAHDRLSTGQEAFYDSLQAIEARVITKSNDSIQQLRQYQELIQQLSQAISTDRLQLAGMSVDLSLKCAQLQDLSAQITQMHTQVTKKSQIIHTRIAEIDSGFTKLTRSVQHEKDQFYELTAQTIDRTAAMQSQFANIAKEFSLDREAIASLQSELTSVRHTIASSTEQQLDCFDLQFYELMTNWSQLSGNRKKQDGNPRKFLTWLWILSAAVGVVLVFLIYILMHLK